MLTFRFRCNGLQYHTKHTQKEGIFQKLLEKNQTLLHRAIKSIDQKPDTGLTASWIDRNEKDRAHSKCFAFILIWIVRELVLVSRVDDMHSINRGKNGWTRFMDMDLWWKKTRTTQTTTLSNGAYVKVWIGYEINFNTTQNWLHFLRKILRFFWISRMYHISNDISITHTHETHTTQHIIQVNCWFLCWFAIASQNLYSN